MEYKVFIEGQNIPVPPEIGETDEGIKNAMRSIFPEVANAQFTRTEKDGVTTITVIKKAGSKGGWQDLISAPAGRNPVILLGFELAETKPDLMDVDGLIKLSSKIQAAQKAGKEQNDAVGYAAHRLKEAMPAASSTVPAGF